MVNGWIGVDLDGTLAYYEGWSKQGNRIGEPIPAMIERVRMWLANGLEVKIFTARTGQDELVWNWLESVGLPKLPITNVKDTYMVALWDDRCVQIITNTGEPASPGSERKITFAGELIPWSVDETA